MGEGAKTEYQFDQSRGRADHRAALAAILQWLEQTPLGAEIDAVGHRVVRGGPDYTRPMPIDAAVLEGLRRYIPLAPLHQPYSLAGVEAALLEGIDALVFTAGIGENSWRVREAALTGMEWLGIRMDGEANRANAERISAADSVTQVYVLRTDEERMIAEHTAGVAGLAPAQLRQPAAVSAP